MLDASKGFGREILGMVEYTLTFQLDGTLISISEAKIPTVGLGHGHFTAPDKGMGMLHGIWLTKGPQQVSLEQWAQSVRFLPSDLGTESAVANANSIIPYLYGQVPDNPDAFLFPLGLKFPGWNHMIDNIVKDTLSFLSWLKEYQRILTIVSSFLQDDSYMDVLQAMYASEGNLVMVAFLLKHSPSKVHMLRWGPIVRSSILVEKWIGVLVDDVPRARFSLRGEIRTALRDIAACDSLF